MRLAPPLSAPVCDDVHRASRFGLAPTGAGRGKTLQSFLTLGLAWGTWVGFRLMQTGPINLSFSGGGPTRNKARNRYFADGCQPCTRPAHRAWTIGATPALQSRYETHEDASTLLLKAGRGAVLFLLGRIDSSPGRYSGGRKLSRTLRRQPA